MRKTSDDVSMLSGPIGKSLLSFALPLLLGTVFQPLYNMADSFVVGNVLGEAALAAVSSASSLINLLVDMFVGLFTGAGILAATCYGGGDGERLSRAIRTTLVIGLAVGVFLTALGTLLSPTLLRLMHTPEDVMVNSLEYFRIYFAGSLAFIMYNCCAGLLQSLGDSVHPLKYLVAACLLNIVLDVLFVAVFDWGVGSAALATSIAQALSAVLCLRRLWKAQAEFGYALRPAGADRASVKQIMKLGVPAAFQNCMIALSNVFVQSGINLFDTQAIAGCGAWSKLEGFAVLPIVSLSLALSTFAGQNLGAGNFERVRRGTKLGIIAGAAMSVAVGAILYIFAPQLIGLFNSDPDVIAFGVWKAAWTAPFFVLVGVSNCIGGILRGMGRTVESMFVYLGCWCLIRVLLINVWLDIVMDIRIVFAAYPITWLLSTVFFTWRYRRCIKRLA